MKNTFKHVFAAAMTAAALTAALPAATASAAVTAVNASVERSEAKTMYITKTCYSYKSNSTKSEKVKKLYKGAAIKTVSETKSFYKLEDGSYIVKSRAGEKRINWTVSKYQSPITRYVSKANTKARSGALSDSKVADTLEKGTEITIVGRTNSGFYKLEDGTYVKTTSVTKTKPVTEKPAQTATDISAFEYIIGNNAVWIAKYIGTDAEVVIPSEIEGYPVIGISAEAFVNPEGYPETVEANELITKVTIPDGVLAISDHAFYKCTNLTEISIPDSVTTIGDGAFTFCINLTEITIPDGISRIGWYAFDGCHESLTVTYKGEAYSGDSIESLHGKRFR